MLWLLKLSWRYYSQGCFV